MADMRDRDRMRKLMVRGLGWCLCVVVWTAALLTVFPVQMSHAVVPQSLHFPASKFLHVSVYAFLTLYLKWLPLGRGRWLLLAFLSLHAAGTEFCQQFIPGRYGMFSDVLIDHFGIALGLALTRKCWLPRRSNRTFSREPIYRFARNDKSRSPSAHG